MKRHNFVYRTGQWALILGILGIFAALIGFAHVREQWAHKGPLDPRGGRFFFQRVALDVPEFSQADERWKDDLLGPTQNTLGAEGCAVASAAMVLASYGVDTDPRRLNAFLKTNDGYTPQGWIYWEKAGEVTPTHVRKAYEGMPSYELIDQNLAKGNPVIVRLRLSSGITHFVVIVGKDGFDYLMRDPAGGTSEELTPLWRRGSDIEALRFYEKP
jgi:hypothetical protein